MLRRRKRLNNYKVLRGTGNWVLIPEQDETMKRPKDQNVYIQINQNIITFVHCLFQT